MYYAVAKGRKNGIYDNWEDCKKQIHGFNKANYKKFKTKKEAELFINNNTIENKNMDHKKINNFFQKVKKNKDANNTETRKKFIPDYSVYTDGACSNNGQKNALAGIGIFFGTNDVRNVSKKICGKQTNNVAELTAIIETYNIIKKDIEMGKKIQIVSDSEYAIRCCGVYGEKCYKNNYKNKKGLDIPNKNLVKRAYELYKNKLNVKFLYCKAHTNNIDKHSIGNDGADKLANEAIGLTSCPYNSNKIYLNIPFEEKEMIKKLGGKWDNKNKFFFYYENNINEKQILSLFKLKNNKTNVH